MRIQIGQTFRVPPSWQQSQPGDFFSPTRGSHSSGVDPNRGVFYYAPVSDPAGITRIPAFLLYSNNLRGLSENNPWPDVVDSDEGYALYHGDNRTLGSSPSSARGNRRILEIAAQYEDPASRNLAPPMLLFDRQVEHGDSGSYRRFAGYGVPREIRIQSQRSRAGTFANIVLELVLFSLTEEGELFDWDWIDQRRDAALTAEDTISYAPAAWQNWVQGGDSVLETIRRRVFGATIRSRPDQIKDISTNDWAVLEEIHRFFTSNAYEFEGLASWAAGKVLGPSSSRGWVTPRIDGGIDFVSRLDIGSGFSRATVVVLGQAKCIRPDGSVSGLDLARTVARLRRGWIGSVVTTGTFSARAQRELMSDQYPIILVNGARLAQEVRAEMALTGISLTNLLRRESKWYESNLRNLSADRIVYGDHWGNPL